MWVFSVKMLNTKCSQWCGCADPSVWVHSLQHTHYSGSGFHEHDNSFLICRLFWLYGAFCHAKVFNLYIVKCESTVLHCFWQECHKVKGSLSSQGVLEPGAKHTPHKDNHSLRCGRDTHVQFSRKEGRALSDINTEHVAYRECMSGLLLRQPRYLPQTPGPEGAGEAHQAALCCWRRVQHTWTHPRGPAWGRILPLCVTGHITGLFNTWQSTSKGELFTNVYKFNKQNQNYLI